MKSISKTSGGNLQADLDAISEEEGFTGASEFYYDGVREGSSSNVSEELASRFRGRSCTSDKPFEIEPIHSDTKIFETKEIQTDVSGSAVKRIHKGSMDEAAYCPKPPDEFLQSVSL